MELTVEGPTGESVVAAIYDVTTSCGGIALAERDACETLTFASPVTTTFGGLETTDGFSRDIQIIPTSASNSPITVSAKVIAANNTCSFFAGVTSSFNISSFTDVDFSFASDSGAEPITPGNDLWFQFDPNTGTDGFNTVASSAVDIQVGGLTGDQEVTLMLYKGNIVSSNNCMNLSNDYITSEVVTSNGTAIINCLDVEHGSAHGGYLLRVVQTAGSTVADNVSIQAFPSPAGPFNNDCENIWNEALSQPAILNASYGAPYFNGWFIPSGTYLQDDFEDATDCHPDVASAVCNSVDLSLIHI